MRQSSKPLLVDNNLLDHAPTFPLRFAQVREDPWLDAEVIQHISKPNIKLMMVASGGLSRTLCC